MDLGSGLLTPEDLADRLPSRPVLTMADGGCPGLTLQRFRHPPSTIDVPGLRDVIMINQRNGPLMLQYAYGAGRRECRWTGPGQVTLTPAGQPVRRILKGRPDVVLLHLAPDLLHEVAMEIYGQDAGAAALVRCLAAPDQTADQLVRLLLAEAESPGPTSSLMLESLGRALVIHLLRAHSGPTIRLAQHEDRPARRIRRVIEQMRSCMESDLSLSQLAETGGLSRSQFVRAFRDGTGVPPHRYLRGLRIEKAQSLLEQTDLSVMNIALTCGFGQASHFATSFRAATGLSPRAWRESRRS